MKFFFDNNLSPHLARALNCLSAPDGHAVVALREKFDKATADVEWINQLSDEGGWAIISVDQFKKSTLEKKAIADCGLLVFSLDRQWARFDYWSVAERLVRWWPKVLQASELLGSGTYRVPWAFTNQKRFEPIR